jgi:hypothetical protein
MACPPPYRPKSKSLSRSRPGDFREDLPDRAHPQAAPSLARPRRRGRDHQAHCPSPAAHSFGTEMVRAGVSLPAVMKLLGHLKPEMTMRYVEVSRPGLTARVPSGALRAPPSAVRLPASCLDQSSPSQPRQSLDSLHLFQHVLEMLRRTLPQGTDRRLLDRLANRLTKITSETRKLGQG